MAQDVRSIATSTEELTATIAELDAIRRRVETLEGEVIRMREAVETMGVDVTHIRESTEPLGRFAGRFARRGQ
jgi:DNA repair ATPase RecN